MAEKMDGWSVDLMAQKWVVLLAAWTGSLMDAKSAKNWVYCWAELSVVCLAVQ
eukprot:CAMPEP_0175013240 /NCGR_PEP_ID=MMETSP0005-20121125/9798_1 /TAXON_ID=420556 /ORGANISM="Ochromonas sp., Strain CCMP1393" /LENGTH=52 /DNA_ID=CAMNT_0016269653 /DNA_START=65 /DNA_END=223 /DNA_ORIENTATION=-